MTERPPPTDAQRLKRLHERCNWLAAEGAVSDHERASRAEYTALLEKIEAATPRAV